jgi:hydroxyethylthiazole kinase-like sugar kinase family protein
MANYAEEAADLAKLGGALVVNMGTVTPDGLKNYKQALEAYNAAGRPVVLDPVGYVRSNPVLLMSPNKNTVLAQQLSVAMRSSSSYLLVTLPLSKATKARSKLSMALPFNSAA